ncbi:unnamed protein product [Periconia digitata]|uniref:Uncharacterized protein n=1 Tax=Periconia digitata TaxID=1303443 RepID=A0A9W4UEG0_9PLEO|nr:unnamed protein product [Periconia digitata]
MTGLRIQCTQPQENGKYRTFHKQKRRKSKGKEGAKGEELSSDRRKRFGRSPLTYTTIPIPQSPHLEQPSRTTKHQTPRTIIIPRSLHPSIPKQACPSLSIPSPFPVRPPVRRGAHPRRPVLVYKLLPSTKQT